MSLAGIMYFAEYIRKVKVLFILSLNIYEREFLIRFIITVISYIKIFNLLYDVGGVHLCCKMN